MVPVSARFSLFYPQMSNICSPNFQAAPLLNAFLNATVSSNPVQPEHRLLQEISPSIASRLDHPPPPPPNPTLFLYFTASILDLKNRIKAVICVPYVTCRGWRCSIEPGITLPDESCRAGLGAGELLLQYCSRLTKSSNRQSQQPSAEPGDHRSTKSLLVSSSCQKLTLEGV